MWGSVNNGRVDGFNLSHLYLTCHGSRDKAAIEHGLGPPVAMTKLSKPGLGHASPITGEYTAVSSARVIECSGSLDDFDLEAEQDAAEYARTQREELERQRVKVENKRRRLQGLPVEKVPRRAKSKATRTSPAAGSVVGHNSIASVGSDDDSRRPEALNEFTYEGRKLIPKGKGDASGL